MSSTSIDFVDYRDGSSSDFGERVVDAFFRRWYLYVLPVLVFGAVGVYSALQVEAEYASYGRLNATANPLVDQPDIRGTEIGPFEAPATATARLINEQLQTDSFLDDVAERAGLAELLEREEINADDLRARLTAVASGSNNLTVSASWADPNTALQLVQGMIAGYQEHLEGLAVADSEEAVAFWTAQKEERTAEVAAAEEALESYLASLPSLGSDVQRPIEQITLIERLGREIERASDNEREAQMEIERAELAGRQAIGTSARGLLVVDEPEMATSPSSVRRDQLLLVVAFTGLGVVLSAAALVIGTSIDRTVRTKGQLRSASGVPTTVNIPRIKKLAKVKDSGPRGRKVAVR